VADRLRIPAAAGALFTLTALTFAYLAVSGVLAVPLLLALGYWLARRVPGAGAFLWLSLVVAPLLSRETFAGWSRMLQGQNPGGPNGLLVIIHGATVFLGIGMLLVGRRSRKG